MPSRRSPSLIAPKPRSAEIRLAARFDDQKPIWRTSYHHAAPLRLRRAAQRRGERAELDRGRSGEARVRFVARVAAGGEVVHPDPGGAVHPCGGRGEPARERRIGPARPVADGGAGQRCERAGAAKAVVAVERLGASDLRPAAREQVGAQRAPLRGDRPRGQRRPRPGHVPRRTGPERRRACSRSRTARRAETAPSPRAERRRPRTAPAGTSSASRIAIRAMRTLYRPRRADASTATLLRRGSRWNA